MTERPTVALIGTGGTIMAVGRDRLDLAFYMEANTVLDTEQLLAAVPEVEAIADVRVVPHQHHRSHGLTGADWLRLRHTVADLLEDERISGVVLTHGTNTIEETAYFLSLTLPSEKPVVLVGAMRPSSAISADGPLNLLNAIRVASLPHATDRGTMVVMNDTIHAARDVSKAATYRVHALRSQDLGPLGYADSDGKVVFYRRAERLAAPGPAFDVAELTDLPRTDIVTSYVGADGTAVDAFVAAGAVGIVSAGTGGGHPTPAEEQALLRAAEQGVVVCQAARVGSGRVAAGAGLVARGFVAADTLTPVKARILLSLALTRSRDPAVVQEAFNRW